MKTLSVLFLLTALAHTQESLRLKTLLPKANTHHQEAFKYGGAGKSWNNQIVKWTPSGRSFIGSSKSGEEVVFTKDELPLHKYILLKVKLFVIYHWDGNWKVYGPDTIRATLGAGRSVFGQNELMRCSFSNFSIVNQSFPDDWPWGSFPPQEGALETGSLGWKSPYGWEGGLDAVYEIWLAAPHDEESLSVTFRGDFHDTLDPKSLQGEQWGIESLDLYTFEQPIVGEDMDWARAAHQFLSDEPDHIMEGRCLLALGGQPALAALKELCAERGLYREIDPFANEAEPEPVTDEEDLAIQLELLAKKLRAAMEEKSPAQTQLAARVYQLLKRQDKENAWRGRLWKEMNR